MPKDVDKIALDIFNQICPKCEGAVMLFPKPYLSKMKAESTAVTSLEPVSQYIIIDGGELFQVIRDAVKKSYANI